MNTCCELFEIIETMYFLQSLLTARLDRKQAHGHEGSQHQSSGGVDGRVDVSAAAVDGDQGGAQSCNTIDAAGNSGSGTAVRGGENFRGVGVQHTVHDVLEEGFQRRADELNVRVGGGGKAEEKDDFIDSVRAAEFLSVTTQRLMTMTSAGKVPYYKLGRSNRYLISELQRLIVQTRKGPLT